MRGGREDSAMKRTRPPFRADHVGSLLRPASLQQAKAKFARGEISAVELKAVEDREISRIIDKQQAFGLDCITDGEFRRHMWHRRLFATSKRHYGIDTDKPYDWGGVKGAALNLQIAGKLDFPTNHPHLDHFRFVKEHASRHSENDDPVAERDCACEALRHAECQSPGLSGPRSAL